MKVVMVEPGQYARAAEIGDDLKSLQAAVGGLIDCAYPWPEKVCIVCNDEGLINGMPMNRMVEGYSGLAGPFFVCGIDGEHFCSLTDEQVEKYQKLFLRPQFFVYAPQTVICMEYDDLTLPNVPQETIKQFKARKNLPECCFCRLPNTGQVIMARYGKHMLHPLEIQGTNEQIDDLVNRLNAKLHVTKQQQTAMLWGSLFGWNIPAADPARYDEQGLPKRHGPKHGDQLR